MVLTYFLLVLWAAMLILFLIPVFGGIVNLGNIFGISVSVLLIAITFFHKKLKHLLSSLWEHTPGKVLIIAAAAAVISGIAFVSVVTGLMIKAQCNTPDEPETLIVLGCKVRGDRPSRMLKARLDAAYDYLEENSGVLCIVSGGKGSDELISEAQAMKAYLTEKGIEPDRIIMEDKSTNTYENLSNSMKLMDELGLEHKAAIATDGFHQYRAGLIAERIGIETDAVNARIARKVLIPTYYVREWFGVAREYVRGVV